MIDSLFGLLPTVLAHHPFGMEELSLSPIQGFLSGVGPVSYTHLTLPTIYSV